MDRNNKEYQRCSVTVMDTTDPDISFDVNGVSNHVYEYQQKAKKLLPSDEREAQFKKIINQMKESGKGRTYDCLIGLSGGVDSSYITYLAGEMGLNALIVHFDNGWNSEVAVNNIKKLVTKYNFDLHTLVVDWEEFKDIQLSFFKASVPNIEVVTDHAIIATLYRIAKKYKIQHLISGSNTATEGILPSAWGYDASDLKHIKAIHKIYGSRRIKTFPHLTLFNYFYYILIRKVKKINILNFIDYSKAKAIKTLETEVGWKYYGAKHYESVFTQFFQAYVLPKKFGFDKRKAHLSTLICSGQITREEALEDLKKPLYDELLLKEHIGYVLKKWELTRDEFDKIMGLPPKQHGDFPINKNLMNFALKVKASLKI